MPTPLNAMSGFGRNSGPTVPRATPAEPAGDSVAVARKLWDKYGKLTLELK